VSDAERWLRAGVVGRPHGLDGSFHVVGMEGSSFRLLVDDMEVRVGGEPHRVVRIAGHAVPHMPSGKPRMTNPPRPRAVSDFDVPAVACGVELVASPTATSRRRLR